MAGKRETEPTVRARSEPPRTRVTVIDAEGGEEWMGARGRERREWGKRQGEGGERRVGREKRGEEGGVGVMRA